MNAAEDLAERDALGRRLAAHEAAHEPLPGLVADGARESLVGQLIDSVRRKRYLALVGERRIDDESADPRSEYFDPMRAAVWHHARGAVDDAFWNLFLFIHFGRHAIVGYRHARDVARALGVGRPWDWEHVSTDPEGFRDWLEHNMAALKAGGTRFGNHRKHENLGARNRDGTGAVVVSYVDWVGRSHAVRLRTGEPVEDPGRRFDDLYKDMDEVHRFGRTARLDYLSTAGHLGLLDVEPDHLYLSGATGPFTAVGLLFPAVVGVGPTARARLLDARATELAHDLGVGTDTMEDALCNWQKSPAAYQRYMG